LNRVCLIRETKKTRSVGVPPAGLGNTALDELILKIFPSLVFILHVVPRKGHNVHFTLHV